MEPNNGLDNGSKEKWMKQLKSVGLFVLLVVLPAGSWYYLRSGQQWRRQAVGELKTFGKIRPAYLILPDGRQINQLDEKVCVIHLFGENPQPSAENKQIFETMAEVTKQFSQNNYYRNVVIWEGGSLEFKTFYADIPDKDPFWIYTGGVGAWKTILMNRFEEYCVKEKVKTYPEYFALTDTSGTIRRFYNALDKQEVERMIQQIAILLPKPQ